MRDIHCQKCNRFLGKTDSVVFLKCEPCKTWQTFKVDTGRVKAIPLTHTRVSAG